MCAEPIQTNFYLNDMGRIVVEEVYDLSDPDCPVFLANRSPLAHEHLLRWRSFSKDEFRQHYGADVINYVPT